MSLPDHTEFSPTYAMCTRLHLKWVSCMFMFSGEQSCWPPMSFLSDCQHSQCLPAAPFLEKEPALSEATGSRPFPLESCWSRIPTYAGSFLWLKEYCGSWSRFDSQHLEPPPVWPTGANPSCLPFKFWNLHFFNCSFLQLEEGRAVQDCWPKWMSETFMSAGCLPLCENFWGQVQHKRGLLPSCPTSGFPIGVFAWLLLKTGSQMERPTLGTQQRAAPPPTQQKRCLHAHNRMPWLHVLLGPWVHRGLWLANMGNEILATLPNMTILCHCQWSLSLRNAML